MKLLDNESTYKAFGMFIRNAREKKGLTQHDVAVQLGISDSHYAYFESGQRKTTLPVALNLCTILGVDLNDFIAIGTPRKKARVIRPEE